eukprot:2918651-Lingulodinium_polyedra.AAC.1
MECGGEGHTWEDHKAALAEAYGDGKGGKSGKGKGKASKGKDTSEQAQPVQEPTLSVVSELQRQMANLYVAMVNEPVRPAQR